MDVSNYFSEEDIKTLDKCLSYASGRKMIISRISREHDHNWQCVETPHHVCSEMFDLIPDDVENYIIFFALEFLEVLIKERGFDGSKVLFVADNQLEADVAFELYGVKDVVYSKQEVNGKVIKKIVEDLGMKFGKVAVVGNPPYQQQSEAQKNRASENGKQQAKPIYHLFVEAVIDYIKPDYFSFIIPSRWMVGGMGLTKHRERMMQDKRIKKIVHFPGEREVFENVSISGGTNYFLWQKDYNGKCEFVSEGTTDIKNLNEYDVILQDNRAKSIIDKIMIKTSGYINKKCFPNKPFGLPTNFSNWTNSGTKCIGKSYREYFVDNSDYIDSHHILNKWKVCVRAATVEGSSFEGTMRSIISNNGVFVVAPDSICIETYIVVAAFSSMEEANNFVSYVKTKFFRFMLWQRLASQHINKEKFAWVPDIDDYSKPWTDEELYLMFDLNNEEIKYIESKIKKLD
jgi:site-specific DNA-methyltransferase (adenine-specific)